jgi:hypothetical protein
MLLLDYARSHSLLVIAALATCGTALLLTASWFVFGLGAVQNKIFSRVSGP